MPSRRWPESVRLTVLALGLTVALLLALAPRPTEAANVGFVRAQGGQFVLDGAPFRFVGTNAYYLMVSAAWGDPSYTDQTMALATQLGFSVLRAWAFNDGSNNGPMLQPAPGVFDETAFRGLDYVLYKADQAGVRLILTLVNRWSDYGGMPKYVQWCSPGSPVDTFYSHPGCRQLYKNYVSYVLNRVNTYKTDFRRMLPEDLTAITTRGEQLTRTLLAHYCPAL